MSESQPILIDRDGNVAVLTLNIPARLNPVTRDLMSALRDQLASLAEDDTVRAIVLTGAGRAFCSGADLSNIAGPEDNRSLGQRAFETMESLSNRLIEDLRSLPVPVVTAVNGPAAGGGVGLALAADVVLAARSAYFYLPFMPRLGLVPDLGATWFLEHFVGRARATALALLGDRLSAEEAAQWGLIWRCVDDASLREEALAIAHRLARLPAHATREIRTAFQAASTNSFKDQLHYEAQRQGVLFDTPELKEGVKAFQQKREPVFR
jgi:2-(1,2-epoxy-1,2-dihydrophenyl)acetyl-CoA isomerase